MVPGKGKSLTSPSRRRRIIVVDDDENALFLVKRFLSTYDYDIDTLEKSTQVLECFESRSYDLAILDIMMPDLDGIGLCRMIKEDERFRDCPVIFMTALDNEEKLAEAFEAGGMDLLNKPINRKDLVVRTQAALKMKDSLDEVHRSHANMQAALFKMKMKHHEAEEALKDLKQVQKTVLFSLAKLAESRDNETGRHLLRVQHYVELLSKSLKNMPKYKRKITNAAIESFVISSPLHDIGKVGIPDSILLKPGKLSNSEFEVMKQHTVIGAMTMREAAQQLPHHVSFLDHAIEIANYHHESNDGSGYPEGLRGEEIPISARIMSLADNYDALRSQRVYKPAYDHDTARKIILEQRGVSFFDEDVLKAFTENEDRFISIAEDLRDDPI